MEGKDSRAGGTVPGLVGQPQAWLVPMSCQDCIPLINCPTDNHGISQEFGLKRPSRSSRSKSPTMVYSSPLLTAQTLLFPGRARFAVSHRQGEGDAPHRVTLCRCSCQKMPWLHFWIFVNRKAHMLEHRSRKSLNLLQEGLLLKPVSRLRESFRRDLRS